MEMRQFDYAKVKDPEYFRDGCLEAHSDHRYFASHEELDAGVESFRESLNGLWKFHYARNYRSAIRGFEAEEYDCRDWEDIYVPAHIQMEGYDAPQYVNTQYPWEGHEELRPGEIPERFNPVASYVKYFSVPERMWGRRIFVSFQGAESGMALWLNGQFLGYAEDSFTPSEFELTEYVKRGANKLAVQVLKWTSGSWCEDQDFYRFSGIYREVYLYAIPDVHIRDLRIRAIPDETLKQAQLEITAKISGAAGARAMFRLSERERIVLEEEQELEEETVFVQNVQHPKLWSAEAPNLYDLTIEVYDDKGILQEIIPQKVGFRRFEMRDRLMLLNGKRLVFKGVNRHEFSSAGGRCVSEEELRHDLALMKRNNINAVRTCHYPNSSLLYSLCDEYGLYMIDETNLETHGTWARAEQTGDYEDIVPGDHPQWLGLVLDRANSMYQRDKNHPSVLIWSCGNESYGGKDIYEISQFFRREDPTRLVHYEGVFRDRRYNATSDMESQMYPSVEMIRDFLAKNPQKPFICCEYTHAMGNSCGGMHKYTDLTDIEPLYQGGFIWDFIDQSIYKKDRYGREFQAYGGDFGERPTDYNFSGNGIVYGGSREASPKMQEVKFNYQNITAEVKERTVRVINKNLFVNTEQFACRVAVARDGREIYRCGLATHTPPLAEEVYELPVPRETIPGEYAVTVSFHLKENEIWAEAGHEVAFGQYIYEIAKEECVPEQQVEVVRSPHNIGVRGEHFETMFSVLNGGMVSYRYAGREMLEMIPMPNFWRAPVDNDCGNLMQARYAQWKIASLYLSHKRPAEPFPEILEPEVEEREKSAVIRFTYLMPTVPAGECKLSYEVFGDGTVEVRLSCAVVKGLPDMPEFGVMFKLNADYDRVEWYGLGPEETYADRKRGAKLGIYRNLVQDNLARYLVPQECGNKSGVRWGKVTDRRGRGMIFEMTGENGPMNFSALPYTPHELENAAHPYELPQVHYTVVRASKAQMGIGGDDSWGAQTHPEYLLKPEAGMEFSFRFRGI